MCALRKSTLNGRDDLVVRPVSRQLEVESRRLENSRHDLAEVCTRYLTRNFASRRSTLDIGLELCLYLLRHNDTNRLSIAIRDLGLGHGGREEAKREQTKESGLHGWEPGS